MLIIRIVTGDVEIFKHLRARLGLCLGGGHASKSSRQRARTTSLFKICDGPFFLNDDQFHTISVYEFWQWGTSCPRHAGSKAEIDFSKVSFLLRVDRVFVYRTPSDSELSV